MLINVTMMSVTATHSEQSVRRFAPWVLLIGVFFAYAPALNGDFVWDDVFLIRDNPIYDDLSTSWTAAWGDFYQQGDTDRKKGGYLRPVPVLINALNIKLFGLNAASFRMINLGIHCLSAGLVLLCLKWLLVPFGLRYFIVGLFALHPLQTEAVLFISCRGDLCAALGVFASLYAYLRARQGGWAWRVLSYFAYGFAILSKEVAIGLPVFLLFLEWLQPGARLSRTFGFWVGALAYLGLRYALVEGVERIYFDTTDLPIVVINLIGFYLGRTVWPTEPRVLYDGLPVTELGGITLVGSFAILGSVWVLTRPRLSQTGLSLSVAWSVVYLSVVLHIVPLLTLASERYLYLPMIGLVGGVSFSLHRLLSDRLNPSRRWVTFFLIGVLSTAATLSHNRSYDWQDEVTLWQAELKVNPLASKAYANLGTAFAERGRYQLAYDAYRRSWQLAPGRQVVFRNLARLEARRLPHPIRGEFLKAALHPQPAMADLRAMIVQLRTAKYAFAARLLAQRLTAIEPPVTLPSAP
ncbi:MAG: hypothetical protein VX589_12015 [Myxococcota bacterium]|nr:hypothetical protein [Myxococcota bacterium]